MAGRGRPFPKGQSGNPKGRPVLSLAECVRRAAGEDGSVYVERLHALAVEPHDNVIARIKAIEVLFKRGWGEPPQTIEMSGGLNLQTQVIHNHVSSSRATA